jgi:thiol:disulfide interchange protein DsbA
MGERERVHQAFFDAIHKQHKKLKSEQELKDFFATLGVDPAKFDEAWNSFAVQTKVNRAQALMRRYGVRSVPVTIVDGRYRSGSGFQGYGGVIEVTKDLVAKVRRERAEVAQDASLAPAANLAKKH